MPNSEAIAGVSVGKRPDARVHASFGRVVVLHEFAQLHIGRPHFGIDRSHNLFMQPLLVSRRDAVRKLGDRLSERV